MYKTTTILLALAMANTGWAQQVTNGNFEQNLTGWTASSINAGSARVVTQGTSFSSGTNTTTVTFPNPTRALNTRSSGPAPTNSVGIATSANFVVTRQTLSWRQRSETSRVNILFNIQNAAGTNLQSFGVSPSVNTFASQSRSVAAQCGQTVRIQLRQNTTQAGNGWYTLWDNISLGGTLCPGYGDNDGDGYCTTGRDNNNDGDCADAGEQGGPVDCDDNNAARSPGRAEVIGNTVDENCDNLFGCYQDSDGDDFGSTTIVNSANASCLDAGESTNNNDCADGNAAINPNATEIAGNTVDENCDNLFGCYQDSDGDDFGTNVVVSSTSATCALNGQSPNPDDCNDADASVFPGAPEIAGNAIDENCNNTWACFADTDGDDFGSTTIVNSANSSCTDAGESTNDDDCDDSLSQVNPNGTDLPGNALDEDCSGDFVCYEDADGDSYGTEQGFTVTSPNASCSDAGESANADDCNDGSGAINPGASEVLGDSVDDNCDGLYACFTDADNDDQGINVPFASVDNDCTDVGEASQQGDCNDGDPTVFSGAAEIIGDAIDQDCDGDLDCWLDADGDTFGTTTMLAIDANSGTCATTSGVSAVDTDCDDTNADINPNATPIAGNSVDEDCSGGITCFVDADGDGYAAPGAASIPSADNDCDDPGESSVLTDCDDTDAAISPDGIEIPGTNADENCDAIYTCYADVDGDTWGTLPAIQSIDTDCDDPGESSRAGDCDDSSVTVNTGADEIIGDAIDQNCDGDLACYVDADGDDYGTSDVTTIDANDDTCLTAVGTADNDDDCDDADADINPGAFPVPGNSIDEDCDGLVTCFVDADGDGFASPNAATITSIDDDCDDLGESSVLTDCDDTSADTNPDAVDIPGNAIDEDCSGDWVCYEDADGDTHGTTAGFTVISTDASCADAGESATADDCNDADATVSPSATDIPGSGIDEDCSGDFTCFLDVDGDGYAGVGASVITSADADCDDPGESAVATDCDDTQPGTNPDATDIPGNDIDEDCDESWVCFVDADGDSYGTDAATVSSPDASCTDPGESASADDCNDADPDISPGATEIPGNSIDEDCSNDFTCFLDVDGDGFAGANAPVITSPDADCDDPGESDVTTDCDDTDAGTNPAATEIPGNSIDEDCDAAWLCFEDLDGDTYGTDQGFTVSSIDSSCSDAGESPTADDCDDTTADANPSQPEILGNDLDEDCDGNILCWADSDGDGFGDPLAPPIGTTGSCEDLGFATNNADCNDGDAGTNPDATDIPSDAIDQDCSGSWACFEDGDGDGFGSVAGFIVDSPDELCDAPGESTTADDCDDAEPSTFPGAPDVPGDGIDSDCSGEWSCFVDQDGDGFGDAATVLSADPDCDDPGESDNADDCDDSDALSNPLGTDVPGELEDRNCDGLWTCWLDTDGDGFGTDAATLDSIDPDCDDLGESANADDCEDGDATIFPGADEDPASGIDANCDGLFTCYIDEDLDGYGNAAGFIDGSIDPDCLEEGLSESADDCDDLDPAIHPDAIDIPGNTLDEDCSGEWTCFMDQDLDGFGSTTEINSADEFCDGQGESDTSDDCDDINNLVNPDATEFPGNGVDEDCDGLWDCWEDADGDGFGNTNDVVVGSPDEICTDAGESDNEKDCDDSDATVFPGAEDLAGDGLDQDCDGVDAEPIDVDLTDGGKWIAGGCNCTTSNTPSAAWLFLLLLPLARRRR